VQDPSKFVGGVPKPTDSIAPNEQDKIIYMKLNTENSNLQILGNRSTKEA